MWILGCRLRNEATSFTSGPSAKLGGATTRSCPALVWRMSWASTLIRSTPCSARSTSSNSSSACEVGSSRPLLRWNNLKPSSVSNCPSRRLTAGWLKLRLRPAAVTEPSRMISRKASSALRLSSFMGGAPRGGSEWAAEQRTRSSGRRHWQHRQQQSRRVCAIQMHAIVRRPGFAPATGRRIGVRIEVEMRIVAAGHVQPDPMAHREMVGSGEGLHLHLAHLARHQPARLLPGIAIAQTQDAVAEVHRETVRVVGMGRVLVDQLDGDVGIPAIGGNEQPHADGPGDIDRARQRRAAKTQHIVALADVATRAGAAEEAGVVALVEG